MYFSFSEGKKCKLIHIYFGLSFSPIIFLTPWALFMPLPVLKKKKKSWLSLRIAETFFMEWFAKCGRFLLNSLSRRAPFNSSLLGIPRLLLFLLFWESSRVRSLRVYFNIETGKNFILLSEKDLRECEPHYTTIVSFTLLCRIGLRSAIRRR